MGGQSSRTSHPPGPVAERSGRSWPRARRRWGIAAAMAAAAAAAAAIAWAVLPRTAPAQPAASVYVTCHDRATDAATLQDAIDASPAGAAIEFRGGTCLLTRGLVLPGDRTYTGGSTAGTILRQDGAAGYVLAAWSYVTGSAVTGDPLAVRDLTIACDGSGHTDGIILLNWQADVDHVDVSGCGGSGIVDTNTGAGGRAITNTSVNSRFDNNFVSGSGRYGFEVIDTGNSVTDGFLDSNQIADSGLDAVRLGNAGGWDVSGNHLYGVGQGAIVADRLYGTTISANYIEDFGDGQRSGTWYGISGTAQNGPGSTIMGNKIFNGRAGTSGAQYVFLAITQAVGTGHAAVTGNVIMGGSAGGVGMLFDGGSHTLLVATSGNEITGVATELVARSGAVATSGR